MGADSNGCSAAQQPGTPVRTIHAALVCVQAGNGDQIMVAEGTSYSDGLPSLDNQAGYSAAYPTVIQSYDPADPLNEGKYGRAANGRRPVINTGGIDQQDITCCNSNAVDYLAIRGFDINPGDKPDLKVTFVGSNSYVLIENNIFRYTSLTFDQRPSTHHVVRHNAFYGEWSATAHAQGLYEAGVDGLTAEDNVFYHNGWRMGVSRDADPTVGGTTVFRHSIYQQVNSSAVVRRNLFIDPSATGCSCRGDTTISENVFIDNPISIMAGLGTDYNTVRPNGVSIDIGYNAILGDADINSANPRGEAVTTGDGKLGSAFHHNLIARSRNPNAVNIAAFNPSAGYNLPTYMDFHDNLEYLYAAPGKVVINSGAYATTQIFATFNNNAWSDPASGTNTNSSTMALPNPYTEAQLLTQLGCTDKASCAAKMIETPEQNWAPKARAILWQGYGR